MFFLEYRGTSKIHDGLWGPFASRSSAQEFAAALGDAKSAWTVVKMRDPDTYEFPEA